MRKSRNLIDRPVCPTECARVNLGRKRNNAFGLYRRLMNFKSDQLTAPNAARVHRELMPHRIANWLSGVSSSSSSSSSSLSLGDASLNLNGVFNECRSRSVCFRAQASNARPNTASSMDSLSLSLSLSRVSNIPHPIFLSSVSRSRSFFPSGGNVTAPRSDNEIIDIQFDTQI